MPLPEPIDDPRTHPLGQQEREVPSQAGDKASVLFTNLMIASCQENGALIKLLKNPQTCDSQEQALMDFLPFLQDAVDANEIESLPIPLFFIPALMACECAPENSSVSKKFSQRLIDAIIGEIAQGNETTAKKYAFFTEIHLRAPRPDIASRIQKSCEDACAERQKSTVRTPLAALHQAVSLPPTNLTYREMLLDLAGQYGDLFSDLKEPEKCQRLDERFRSFIEYTYNKAQQEGRIPEYPIFFAPALVVCRMAPLNSEIYRVWRGYLRDEIAERYHRGNDEIAERYMTFVNEDLMGRPGNQQIIHAEIAARQGDFRVRDERQGRFDLIQRYPATNSRIWRDPPSPFLWD